MTLRKAFIYTGLVFALITGLSYIAYAQPKQLSLQQALSLTLANNRNIRISALDVDRAEQQTRVAKAATLLAAGISAQSNDYFNEAPFVGFSSTRSG